MDNSPEHINHSDYPLPKVDKDIAESLLADAREIGIDKVMQSAGERLSTNNPDLYLMVGSFLQSMDLEDNPQAINAAHKSMIMTHELLRRQAETDFLNEQL